jgi:hypothetical protein
MKIYLAGPMRGIRDFNFPAFHAAAKALEARGHEVFNPAAHDEALHGAGSLVSATGDLADIAHVGFSHREAMAADTQWICNHADAIAMMPGWEKSTGAFAEWALAKCLGLEVIYLG